MTDIKDHTYKHKANEAVWIVYNLSDGGSSTFLPSDHGYIENTAYTKKCTYQNNVIFWKFL